MAARETSPTSPPVFETQLHDYTHHYALPILSLEHSHRLWLKVLTYEVLAMALNRTKIANAAIRQTIFAQYTQASIFRSITRPVETGFSYDTGMVIVIVIILPNVRSLRELRTDGKLTKSSSTCSGEQ